MLVGQVLRLDLPCLLALTMADELSARGGRIDVEALSTALGIPVAAVVAHRGSGIDGRLAVGSRSSTTSDGLFSPAGGRDFAVALRTELHCDRGVGVSGGD
jgi:ferrous iron transport protein B